VRVDWSATTSEAVQETHARVSEIRGDTLEVCLANLPSMESRTEILWKNESHLPRISRESTLNRTRAGRAIFRAKRIFR
jgi:hypothetical protein